MDKPKQAEIKVQSLTHLHSLVKRNFTSYKLEAKVAPSGEIRSCYIYVDMPKQLHGANENGILTDNFGYDACVLVLTNPGKYSASIYCLGDWSAHEIAEETAKWT